MPRGKGLGYAMYLPKERYLYTREQVGIYVTQQFFIESCSEGKINEVVFMPTKSNPLIYLL